MPQTQRGAPRAARQTGRSTKTWQQDFRKKELSDVLSAVDGAIQQVSANLPYVEKCFNESMDKKIQCNCEYNEPTYNFHAKSCAVFAE